MKITDGRVIADFSKNILRNEDIVLFSKGRDTRTFCYISDAVVGYLKILLKGRTGEAYNIGIEKPEITVARLARQMADIARMTFGYRGTTTTHRSQDRDYLTDNPQRRCPTIDKARSELGFDPEITLTEGLRKTLLWYKATNSTL